MTSILDLPIVARVRRNHAVEHATIHVLSARNPHLRLMGRTGPSGFTLYGWVHTEEVASAVAEALNRLQAGEYHLAIHPHCGTNMVVGGMLAGLAAFAALIFPRRSKWRLSRLPDMMLATMLTLLVAQPLGLILQERVTTSPEVRGMFVRRINRQQWGRLVVHEVILGQE
ncbi:MAG: DUF6391 domain-containing protein [Anaerolineae bacterium]|nr:DUF6391 domain-containing protein [Anaerolineae bacterium]MDH7473723.1 DUF6391 domain-containing protein [Anaerolineae bacterium]